MNITLQDMTVFFTKAGYNKSFNIVLYFARRALGVIVSADNIFLLLLTIFIINTNHNHQVLPEQLTFQ